MSSTWLSGGDQTVRNQLRDPLKARYSSASFSQRLETGPKGATTVTTDSGELQTLRQVVKSYGHPVNLLGRSDFDIGGEFYSLKAEITGGRDFGVTRIYGGNPDYISNWNGRLYASSATVDLLQQTRKQSPDQELAFLQARVPGDSLIDLYRDGTTAIARTAPTNPLVDLSTSLAELYREGLPSLPGRNGNVGGEYLNVQFGVLPIASDIRKLREVASQAEALIAQYERNSGRGVRRRYEFDPIRSSSETSQNFKTPAYPQMNYSASPSGAHFQPGTLSIQTTSTTRRWFSGSFTYYLPQGGWRKSLAELDRLYGIVPGIDTLYQLTPWSWLVDYFANLGDVVQNLNTFASNGLVMPYGYAMSQTDTVIRSKLDFQIWTGSRFEPATVFDTVELSAKRRVPAHPYGFGILDSGLTGKQMSILAALGLSRR